jgi:hypothetical protein
MIFLPWSANEKGAVISGGLAGRAMFPNREMKRPGDLHFHGLSCRNIDINRNTLFKREGKQSQKNILTKQIKTL